MVGKLSCTDWDYDAHPKQSIVGVRCTKVLVALRRDPVSFQRYGYSTLVGHKYLFRHLTPTGCPYMAGNYRGAPYPGLRTYEVMIAGNPGMPALLVATAMRSFEADMKLAVDAFDLAFQTAKANGKEATVTYQFSIIAANFLVRFLEIHPYANGNGHMGRLIVWVLLGRFGFWPKAWPLDERPSYDDLIAQYRKKIKGPLEKFILRCVAGT